MFDYGQIRLDFRVKIPLYIQLSEQIRAQVELGALQPDEQLPPVRSLAERLNVNFNTVARAYRILDIEGWITTQQGRGTYITPQSWPRPLAPILHVEDTVPSSGAEPVEETTMEKALLPENSQSISVITEPAVSAIESSPADQVNIDRLRRIAIIEDLFSKAADIGITVNDIRAYLLENIAAAPPADEISVGQAVSDRKSVYKDSRLRRIRPHLIEFQQKERESTAAGKQNQLKIPGRKGKRNPVR